MPEFNKFLRYSANIGEMMERMGIEYDKKVEDHLGPSMQAMIRSCQVCRASGLCSDWLAKSPVAVSRAPTFCPFAERLDGLLGETELWTPPHTVH